MNIMSWFHRGLPTCWLTAHLARLSECVQNSGLGTSGYAIPVGSANQLQASPWNDLNQIRYQFDGENVNVSENSLIVTGVSAGRYAFSNFSYSNVTHTAIWTLASPIGTDRVFA